MPALVRLEAARRWTANCAGLQPLAVEPLAGSRMLDGSDWSMISRLPSHPAYLAGLTGFMDELTGGGAASQAIMGGNVRRWLGSGRDGPQKRRLARFHGGHDVWRRLA